MERDPRNAPGQFFVQASCCTLCGVPWMTAPTLFTYDDEGCWVSKQPTTTRELERMVEVINCAELACVHYQGDDPKILVQIKRR